MPHKSLLPQSRHHIHIYDEDWEFLQTRFGPSGLRPVGIANAIRNIIHLKIQELRAREIAKLDLGRHAPGPEFGASPAPEGEP